MWDWDEVLFAGALHHYDVAQHHPHPPGFPLFFAMARVARIFIHDDFHALRAISILASLFVFPAMFALARSLRFRFRTCVVAALLFSFLPNVWYWGGTGFTDELALVTALAGAALLLRDDTRRSTYILGCILFAATMLVRAQNVLLAWPWIVASWRRWRGARRRDVIIGTALILVLVCVGYGIAVELSGIDDYIDAVKSHQQYIVNVDGLLNPIRPPMRDLFFHFLFDPFRSGTASMVMFAFTIVAFLRPRRAHLDAILTFLPNFLLAWLFLSPTGISRLSLGYIAMNVLLAADGMDVVATFVTMRLPRERIAAALQTVFAVVLIGRFIVWIRPGLSEVRHHDSPPVQAMRWIRQNVPRGAKIYFAPVLAPFPAYFLAPDYTIVEVAYGFDPSKAPAEKNAHYVTDVLNPSRQAVNFRRSHDRLWSVFNERYFEASVQPITGWIRFGPGWYAEEQGGEGERWRWMGKESHTQVEALGAPALIGFSATFPLEGEPPPHVTVTFDGNVIDRFVPAKNEVERRYAVQSRSGASDELVIAVDQAYNPARAHQSGDTRDLGLQLHSLTWKRR
jgi:hypothetical protein